MKKRIISIVLVLSFILLLCGCSKTTSDSYFRITFIDVGQGDSALIECDGEYMLIDAGIKSAGETVVDVLKERNIDHLDILVASHLHDDHIGGMVEVLEYLDLHKGGNKIDLVLSNSTVAKTNADRSLISQLDRMGNVLTVPEQGATYKLGSATIEVIDNRAEKNNDSLVLLITYRNTTFLFTGDMEQNQESQICDRYGDNKRWDITLLKVSHHGSKTSTSIRFLNILMPTYAIISVGENQEPDHPSEQTLSRLEQADVKGIYATDDHGTIIVEVLPNGKDLEITTSR
jgi:competence protein ComEC